MNIEEADRRQAIIALLEEEDFGFWKNCPVKGCGKSFPNFSALVAHMRRDHPGTLA